MAWPTAGRESACTGQLRALADASIEISTAADTGNISDHSTVSLSHRPHSADFLGAMGAAAPVELDSVSAAQPKNYPNSNFHKRRIVYFEQLKYTACKRNCRDVAEVY